MAFKPRFSKKTTETAAATPVVKDAPKPPEKRLCTKDEEGQIQDICGLWAKTDKRGLTYYLGSYKPEEGSDDKILFFLMPMTPKGKTNVIGWTLKSAEAGGGKGAFEVVVDKLEEFTAKSGLPCMKGVDADGQDYLVFTNKPKEKKE